MFIKYKAATTAGTLLLLVFGRDAFFENNLFDNGWGVRTYDVVDCNERTQSARTEDGTCNDADQPLMGAANVPFGRNVKKEAIYRESEEKTLYEPNPIDVSRSLMRREKFQPLDHLNLMVTSWIQFQNHDWFDHNNAERDYANFLEVPIPPKYQGQFKQEGFVGELRGMFDFDRFMVVPRTEPLGQLVDRNGEAYDIFTNRVSHWWDGSQIYGSNLEISSRIRSFKNGLMRVTDRNLIPYSKTTEDEKSPTAFKENVEETGFFENWWVGLSMFHNLFIRNHNAIAQDPEFVRQVKEQLKESQALFAYDADARQIVRVSRDQVFASDGSVIDPVKYNAVLDQMLYDKARLVNTAIIAKIHTIEWTPAVLQTKALDRGMRANWYGLLEGQKKKTDEGTEEWERILKVAKFLGLDDTKLVEEQMLFGLVGRKKDLSGSPFVITEEFTAVYRLHSLLPEDIQFFKGTKKEKTTVPVTETREEKSRGLLEQYGLGNLFYSFGQNHPGALTLGNFPRFLQDLEVPIMGKLDMGAIDVLRDRERGVPRYNEFRRQLQLPEIISFADLFAYASIENLEAGYKDCMGVSYNSEQPGFRRQSAVLMRTTQRSHYNYAHCKLWQMQDRVERYKKLWTEAQESGQSVAENKDLTDLKNQIHRDYQERWNALNTEQQAEVKKFRKLYNPAKGTENEAKLLSFQKGYQRDLDLGDNVDALDLLVGTLAESFRGAAEPENHMGGFGFGETAFQIFLGMASRRLKADHFYAKEGYTDANYTPRGKDMIEMASLKGVMVCNLKEQRKAIKAALKCTRTAFDAWNLPGEKPGKDKCWDNEYEEHEQHLMANYEKICSR